MGYETISGEKNLNFIDFSAGWFPGKEHNDIPGDINSPNSPLGMADGENVIWYEGALRNFFGTSNVTTSALDGSNSVNSLFYSYVLDDLIGTAGTKLFSNMDNAAPTDQTSSLTIANSQISWAEWEFKTDKYAIGADGTNDVFYWDGSTAAVLGATVPQGKFVAVWQDVLWVARTSSKRSSLFFSNLGDPTVFDTDDEYTFDSPITGLIPFGDQLVVFMEDHIGILTGTNNRLLTKVNRFVTNVGTRAGYAIVPVSFGGSNAICFHGFDGWYIYQGTQNPIYLSHPIRRKYINSDSAIRWNEARFENMQACRHPRYNWYMCSLSDGGDSVNQTIMVLDLTRIYETKEGIYVPHWPVQDLTSTCLAAAKISNREEIYFGSTDSKVKKIDESITTREGSGYTGFFKSKIFDNIQTIVIDEVNVLGDQQNVSVDVYINMDLQDGDGDLDSVNLSESATGLGAFILDTDKLAGKDFIFKHVGLNPWGRYLQFKLGYSESGDSMEVNSFNIVGHDIGLEENYEE